MALTAALETVLKFILLPPACLLLLYAFGLMLGRRRARIGKFMRHGSVVLLYFLSSGAGAWLLAHPLESLEPVLDAKAAAQAQAIVVLTAGRIKHSPEYGGRATPDHIALKRMAYGAHLARATGLPLLVTGGLLSDAPDDEPLALGMQRVFENDFGIPVRWLENASRNTAENARFSATMLRRDGVRHIILVTDALHMRRARAAFEREGLAVTPGPTFNATPDRIDWRLLLPTMDNLGRSHYALYEWLGLARYQFH
jgi:uncharacterized SAM-binding protein YcdF (DUF218 family)